MKLAEEMASIFSKDPSCKVGAIMLAPESMHMLSLGYNGMPRGVAEGDERRWERPQKYSYVEHAERNCIYNASRHGTPLCGCIAVVTMFPCVDCARAIIQVGVKTLVSRQPDYNHVTWGESFRVAWEMFDEAGVEVMLTDKKDCVLPFNPSQGTPVRSGGTSVPSARSGV
jgi:dCMP deaminase